MQTSVRTFLLVALAALFSSSRVERRADLWSPALSWELQQQRQQYGEQRHCDGR